MSVTNELVLNISNYKKLKYYIKKYNYDRNIKLGLLLDNKVYYNDSAILEKQYKINQIEYWFILAVHAINIKDKFQKYKYIYYKMCDILDEKVCVLCDFKCNKCSANRLKKSVHSKDGCCYFRNIGLCPYLIDKKCTKKSLACKLFMCSYIEKKYKFYSVPSTYPLLNLFFNKKQKDIIQHSFRLNFEEFADKLM